MENFFGISPGSSSFDKRRHINTIYTEFFIFRYKKDGEKNFIVNKLIPILEKDRNERYNDIMNTILSKYEYAFLCYLMRRYNLSEDEFVTIIAGETHFNENMKTPASYSLKENYRLIIQMLYAIMCVPEYYQSCTQQVIIDFMIPIAKQIREISNIGMNKFIIISNLINEALNNDWYDFDDLPKIENYVLSRIM